MSRYWLLTFARVATQQEKSYRQNWKSGYKPMVVFQQTETHCDITMHYLYLTTPVWANKFLKTASMNLDPDVITLKTPFCHLVVVSPFMLYLFLLLQIASSYHAESCILFRQAILPRRHIVIFQKSSYMFKLKVCWDELANFFILSIKWFGKFLNVPNLHYFVKD